MPKLPEQVIQHFEKNTLARNNNDSIPLAYFLAMINNSICETTDAIKSLEKTIKQRSKPYKHSF